MIIGSAELARKVSPADACYFDIETASAAVARGKYTGKRLTSQTFTSISEPVNLY